MRLGLKVLAMVACVGMVGMRARGAEFSVANYVDGETVAGGRVTLSKIDTKAIQAYVVAAARGDKDVGTGVLMAKMGADVFLNGVKEHGATEAYVVVSQSDAWPGRQPVAVLFPVAAGGDAPGLAEFLARYGELREMTTEVLGGTWCFWGRRCRWRG